MSDDTCGYEVSIDHCHPDDTPVGGCGCGGPPSTVADIVGIGACSLTPGDPSPIGRCPDCDELLYVETPTTRLRDAAPDLLAALESLVAGNYGQPRGVTVPALDAARAAISKATGQ